MDGDDNDDDAVDDDDDDDDDDDVATMTTMATMTTTQQIHGSVRVIMYCFNSCFINKLSHSVVTMRFTCPPISATKYYTL